MNLPTADAHDFVAPELDQPIPLRYPRDPSLDPQLVWKGKDVLDGEDLVVDAPPIYIQEKIDPRALIEDLRRNAAGTDKTQLTLFDSFDGLPELDIIDFYRHEANWSNRMILGDSLNVMASLAEREALRGKVQMVYFDPPYGIKFNSNGQATISNKDVTDGRISDFSREVELIKAFRDTWELGVHSYLTYLRDRLTVARDLLARSGSIFVQISNDNVHLVRAVLDEVFGRENVVTTIVWKKASPDANVIRNSFHYVLWYARDKDVVKAHKLYRPRRISEGSTEDPRKLALWGEFPDGSKRPLAADEKREEKSLPPGTVVFRSDKIVDLGTERRFPVVVDGEELMPPPGYQWRGDPDEMQRLNVAGRILKTKDGVGYRFNLTDFDGVELTNLWEDTAGKVVDKVYVVQTHTKIIERCILMASDPGDLVLDPTCGSGTTAYVAEQWGRRWITIDTSRVALTLARGRLMGAEYPYYLLADSTEGRRQLDKISSVPLPKTAVTNDIRHGFVYERVSHITLKSIANNPDITDGLSKQEVETVIRRHAESEPLFDQPYQDTKKVRVSGPFTVESLSPHRALAFAGGTEFGDTAMRPTGAGSDRSFEQTILANLRTAGIQNGRRNQRLLFDSLEPYAGLYIQAVGIRNDVNNGTPKRIGITIGPQYGTVGPAFIKEAAREANRANDLALLCVMAFAFDPSVIGTGENYVTSDEGFANVAAERRLGRVPVLLVRMNADLVMGEELKKTGAGNLFTVFGEPDIQTKEQGDAICVVLNGVDVYDPNSGQLRSNGTDQVAVWMVDTNYNGESFFVRHCYFTGGKDPFGRLKRSLRADIDGEAWASLYRTESRPFPRPSTGKIAVKVINDYGDEVMKVFSV